MELHTGMASETKIDEAVNAISQRIVSGVYETGERLPSERDLAEELHVSRQTIRTALLRLQSENVIEIVPKSGNYVRFPRQQVTIGPLQPLHIQQKGAIGIYRALEEEVKETHVRFLAPPTVAEARGTPGIKMNLKVGAQLLRSYRLYQKGKTPYRIVDSYYLADLLPAKVLANPDLARQPDNALQWLQPYAEPIHPDVYERIRCRMPDSTEVELLNIHRNQPVVHLERWIFVSDGRVFEYSVNIANAALHEFTYTYNQANWEDLTNKIRLGS